MTIAEHEKWLENYIQDKIDICGRDPAPLLLKKEHTLKVYARARALLPELPERLGRPILLAALFHDIARFDQYLEFGTFRDRDSFNHGARGAQMLKKLDALEGEPERRKILGAIALHNVFHLPGRLNADLTTICHAVRDADKLDILRVIASHLRKKPYNPTVILSLPDDEGFSPVMIENSLAGKMGSYNDLVSVNDFRLLLGTWFFDMHFERSRQQYIDEGFGRELVAALPDNAVYGQARAHLLEQI